jgi:Flp pilus assembly protein TadD
MILFGVALIAAALVLALRGGDDKPAAKTTPPKGSAAAITPDAAAVVETPDAAVIEDAAIAETTPDADEAEPPVVAPVDAAVADHKPTRPSPPTPKPNAQELFKTGMQAFVKGDAKSAVVSFRKATAANPSYGAAWRALGLAHEKLGEWGPAKTAFQKYLSVSPNAADAAQIRDRIKNL